MRLLIYLLHPIWRALDWLTPKRPDYWAFATHHLHTNRFVENQRAIFEQIKNDTSIRKIIFFRGATPDLQIDGGVRYEALRLGSWRSFVMLARCKVLFVTHSISMDYSLRWGTRRFSILKLNMQQRIVVNLWHGIPLKRLLYATNDATLKHTDRIKYRFEERKQYAGLIASSDIDSYAMAAMFYPANYRQVWLTGLPRNDFLLQNIDILPRYISESIKLIRAIKKNRRLVVYAPTYRQTEISDKAYYYQFSEHEINDLKKTLKANNAILGYRPHYFKNSSEYFNLDKYIDGEIIVDISQSIIPEFSAVARECDLLITDYSSVFIETLYLGKPAICFAYDLEHYKSSQDGLLYELSLVFPGPICSNFDDVLVHIRQTFQSSGFEQINAINSIQKLFFKFRDVSNSKRVVRRIQKSLFNE
ncbi:CDP-glycerol glycerophosphotransferase family protein [Ferribacterium limneticum]|uniref:CDP-glycerol glycerophosphotransferase family protein n=1 Tax=Ferribacterium limneticum TaxID=76259 RepID=UPI001CFBE685|nr:CDP-glycerol glycerophosphotransferase family protein [Ferribacterium limneticum]